jgi:hypothetical protein
MMSQNQNYSPLWASSKHILLARKLKYSHWREGECLFCSIYRLWLLKYIVILWCSLQGTLIDMTQAGYWFILRFCEHFTCLRMNNCRLLRINIVSFIFFDYRESKPPFCLHYEKSSPVNIVYRKITWKK